MVHMKKTKVLMVGNHSSAKGGITSVISQLLQHGWDADGIEMTFIPTYIEANAGKKACYFAAAYLKILKRFLFDRPDVVHMHMSYKGSFRRKYMIHKLCRRFGVRDVVHLHGSEFQKWYDSSAPKLQEEIRTLLRESAAFLVLGEKWDAVIRDIEPQTHTVVVSNTVHIPDGRTVWEGGHRQVLFLGVLIERKGVHDLLRAVRLLEEQGQTKDIRFVIAGSGEEERALKQQCTELGLDHCVTFAGWIDREDKRRLLTESQLLVLPSYNEGLPIAILEAISYGMPVVSTDVGDISAAVREGENGYLIERGDVSALADRINRVFESRETYQKMSDVSRRLAEEQFSDTTYFEKLKQCYLNTGDHVR